MVVVPPRRNHPAYRDAACDQIVFGGLARVPHGRPDASAGRRDLLIRNAFHSLFKFVGAISGEHGMRVRVDESGHHHASTGVDDFNPWFDREIAACPGICDAPVANQHRTVANDAQFAQFRAQCAAGKDRRASPAQNSRPRRMNSRSIHRDSSQDQASEFEFRARARPLSRDHSPHRRAESRRSRDRW